MECACDFEVDMYDGELCDFHHAKMVKAAVDQKCNECGSLIKQDLHYEIIRGRFEGEWFTHKTCPTCLELREKLFSGGFYYGMIEEHIRENLWEIGGISETCIAELSPPARSALCDLIEEALDWEELNAIDDENE